MGPHEGSYNGPTEPETHDAKLDSDYLLWVLSDSNLPTGGFIASAGLESYSVHGFLDQDVPDSDSIRANGIGSADSNNAGHRMTPSDRVAANTVDFVRSSLGSYASSALPYLLDAHRCVTSALDNQGATESEERLRSCIDSIVCLDKDYHAFLTGHVVRRASKAQGVALLTLYSKSFADAPLGGRYGRQTCSSSAGHRGASFIVDELKRRVRASSSRLAAPHAHLPICWGVFTACLGIEAKEAVSLHLFLQARAILSSSIRLNTLGPYLAHGLLVHEARQVVQEVTQAKDWVKAATTGLIKERGDDCKEMQRETNKKAASNSFEADWTWDDDDGAWEAAEQLGQCGSPGTLSTSTQRPVAPVNTWPLGEIVQNRHDVLHVRLFNS